MVVGWCVSWIAFGLSGCPYDPVELELEGLPTTCRSGWESEASWLVAVLAVVLMFVAAPLAVIAVPVWAVRRHRRG